MTLSATTLDAGSVRERLLAGHVNNDLWNSILNRPEFIGWAYEDEFAKLYIHGPPQSGKTAFSAAVAEKLLSENGDPDTVEVASIFLDPDDYFVDDLLAFGEGDIPVRHSFLRNIVQQLSKQDMVNRSQTEKLEDLRAIVKTTCASAKTYVIVDGLDRCLAEVRHELEDEIANLIACGCLLMVTNYLGLPVWDAEEYTCGTCDSDNPNHNWWCRNCNLKMCDDCTESRQCLQLGHDTQKYEEVALGLTPSYEDMCTLIDEELSLRLNQRDYDDELDVIVREQRERIVRAICDKSKGVLVICNALLAYLRDFQWAGYEEIMHLQTRVLRPEEEVFDVLMRKIKQQSSECVTPALIAFSLASQIVPDSTMTFEELNDALMIMKVEKPIRRQDLYALCQGMLVINSDDTVTPFHDDFSIYLQENRAEDLRHLHVNLAGLTIQSILALPCYNWTADTASTLEGLISKSPLLSYAAPNWGHHLRRSAEYRKFDDKHEPPAGSLISQALDFLQTPQKLAASLYIASQFDQEFEIWPGCHELHVCAWYGLTKFIKHFSSADSSLLNVTDPVYGRTPLMIAASRGYVDFTQRVIELGADVSFESEDGRSALLEAVEHDARQQGYYDTTRLILDGVTDPKKRRHAAVATTPLMACISRRDHNMQSSQLLELLLGHPSIDVNEVTLDGQTALMRAVGVDGSEAEIIPLLLKRKDLRLDVQDKTGKTVLHLAAQRTDSTTVINIMLQTSQCTPQILNIRDACGTTSAMLLLRNEFLKPEEVIRTLRKMSDVGADFHCVDNNGRGLLHAAAAGEQASAVDFLHCEKKLPLDCADVFGWGALHYASRTRAPATVKRLLQLGADSTLRDARGWSPVEIIKCDDPDNEHVQAISGLLHKRQPSSVAEPPPTHSRPAWTFASSELADFQEYCVSATDDFWLPDPKCGNLAFHCAVEENNIPLCEVLLEHTDINAVNAEGKSALFLAVERYEDPEVEYFEMIEFLLDRGASLQVGGSCYDALEAVRQRGIFDLAVVFIERGDTALRYGPDFRQLFEEAARTANTSVIEKLHNAQLHPLKRHGSSRMSEIVQAGYIGDEVKDLVAAMQHTALERIWPACDTTLAPSLNTP